MLVRIIARNKKQKYAFAEKIIRYQVISKEDNRIVTVNNDGSASFCDLRDLVFNPEIIKVLVKGYFYKIKLPEGL